MTAENPPSVESIEHRMKLGYTTDDDGVWVYCSCGERWGLGYEPVVEAVIALAGRHREVADPG